MPLNIEHICHSKQRANKVVFYTLWSVGLKIAVSRSDDSTISLIYSEQLHLWPPLTETSQRHKKDWL